MRFFIINISMKSFIQFLSESDNSFNNYVNDLLTRLKGTKAIDPKTGLPQPLYRGTSATPNFDFAETGRISNNLGTNTWGPGQYWTSSPTYAERYLTTIPNSIEIKQPWYLRPFKPPTSKTTHSYAPGSRIITAYANIENPIEMGYGENIPTVGERLGISIPDNFKDRKNPDYLARIQSALDERGIDAIKAYDKKIGEVVPHEIINVRDPKKIILSPHVLAPQTTKATANISSGPLRAGTIEGYSSGPLRAGTIEGYSSGPLRAGTIEVSKPVTPTTTQTPASASTPTKPQTPPSGARRGAISADTLALMSGVGSAVVGGMAAAAPAAIDSMVGLLHPPDNRTRQQMEKMFQSDAGLAFNITPEGELEGDPAGFKAVRERQKRGEWFPTYYPQAYNK